MQLAAKSAVKILRVWLRGILILAQSKLGKLSYLKLTQLLLEIFV